MVCSLGSSAKVATEMLYLEISSPPIEKERMNSQKKQPKTKYQKKQRVLIVGDSLVHNTNFRKLENVTNNDNPENSSGPVSLGDHMQFFPNSGLVFNLIQL